jgi:hypothetical protein
MPSSFEPSGASPPARGRARALAMGTVMGMCLASCAQLLSPTPQERLLGSWEWLEATGGFAGGTRTPESTGETMSLRFRDDDSVMVVKDGEPFAVAGFALGAAGRDGEKGALSVTYDPPIFGFESQMARFLTLDTLVLTDPCCDGFVYRFVRTSW